MFIELRIDEETCARAASCQICLENCPVDVFRVEEGKVCINRANEDECILCDLCLTKCPTRAINLTKLY